MEILIFFLIFVFGSVVGSFLNCVIYRLQTGESFLKGRSYCPHCKHILSWQDLIPLFSFLILKGKCRYCSQKISWQYPLVEFFTGFLFSFSTFFTLTYFSYDRLTFIASLFFNWVLISFLIIIFVYDLKHYIIPDQIIYPAITTTLLYHLIQAARVAPVHILGFIYSAFGAAAFFLAIVLVSREKWMGLGDVKLAFFMGLFLGFPNILVALFLAFFIGAIIGLILIALGKKTLKSEIPFGPFLVTGTFLAMFFGQHLINFYQSLFLL